MAFRTGRLHCAVCLLMLLLLCKQSNAQGATTSTSGLPPNWMTPIGSGTTTPTTPTATPTATGAGTTPPTGTAVDPNAAAAGTTTPAAVPNTPTAVPATTTPTTTPPATTDPNAVVATPGTPPATATATPATTTPPTAVPATTDTTTPPTDPNAVPAVTDTTPPTDPNAVPAVTATTGTTPPATTDPLAQTAVPATTGLTPTDPNALGAVAAAPQGALVDPSAAALPPAQPSADSVLAQPDTTPAAPPPMDTLPPGPPLDWSALPLDTAIVFGMDLVGPSLVPWTKTKSWVFNNVLQSRYLRSCDVNDIETGPLNTYSTTVPAPPAGMGTRRLARRLLQDTTQDTTQESGVILRVTVLTNTLRVESEVRTVADGVSSGSLASDLTMALGTPVTNVTFTQQPTTMPYNTLPDPNANTGGSLPGWIIGTIVGAILVLMPIPAYILYKRHKRKHLEALEKQQAEAAAARQRMQSRIIKSGGKSFTRQGTNGLDAHDIYALGGPLGSPYGPGSVAANSRQNSMTGVNPMLGARTNSFASPQRLLYQQNSLGPGGMPAPPSPSRTHSRTPSFAHARQHSGAVFPIRYSDEASTSSGNISEPNEKMRH